MKKIVLTLIFALVGMSSAFAQFEKGKYYLAANTNAAGFSYSKERDGLPNVPFHRAYCFLAHRMYHTSTPNVTRPPST